MKIEIPVVDRLEPRLLREWDALALATNTPPFLRPGWLLPWAASFDPRTRVVLAREANVLRGVLPIISSRRTIRSATNTETAVWQPIAESGTNTLDEILRQLLSGPARHLAFSFLPGSGTAISDAARSEGFTYALRSLRRSPVIDVSTDWNDYLATHQSKKERTELRRRARRLTEGGELGYSVHDGSEHLDALLEEGFRLEASGWKGAAHTAVLSRPAARRYYVDGAKWAASNGLLRLRFLRLNGRPIAFQLILEQSGFAYLIKIGHDASLNAFGPGTLLLYDLIESSFASPSTHTLVLGGEDEGFKKTVATGYDEQVRIDIWASPLEGFFASRKNALSNRAHEQIRQLIPIERRVRHSKPHALLGDAVGSVLRVARKPVTRRAGDASHSKFDQK
jgi:CelD/BcsL family acetyltransferase involved in cellulose biosynthesis